MHAWEHMEEALSRHLRRVDSVAAEIADVTEQLRSGVSEEASATMSAPTGSTIMLRPMWLRPCSSPQRFTATTYTPFS